MQDTKPNLNFDNDQFEFTPLERGDCKTEPVDDQKAGLETSADRKPPKLAKYRQVMV